MRESAAVVVLADTHLAPGSPPARMVVAVGIPAVVRAVHTVDVGIGVGVVELAVEDGWVHETAVVVAAVSVCLGETVVVAGIVLDVGDGKVVTKRCPGARVSPAVVRVGAGLWKLAVVE